MQSNSGRFALALVLLLALLPAPMMAAPNQERFEIPNGEILAFSPDGQWLLAEHPLTTSAGSRSTLRAMLQPDDDDEPKLCVYAFPSLAPRSCTAAGTFRGENGPRGIVDSVTWSPDGESIAFSDGSIRIGIEGDIWQLETASGRFTNLTDDGFSGQLQFGERHESPVFLDTNPSYAPDGESIAFVRTVIGEDGRARPTLSKLDLALGEVELIAALRDDPFQLPIGNIIWSATASSLWFTTTGIDETVIGLYSVATDGSAPVQITAPVSDSRDELVLLEIDPSESFALVGLTRAMTRFDPPFFALIDLQTGEISPISPDLGSAESAYDVTFTHEGDLLFSVETRGEGSTDDTIRLMQRDQSTGQETDLLSNLPDQDFSRLKAGLTIITDDLIAYPINDDESNSAWIAVSRSGLSLFPASPEAGTFIPGDSVITLADIALRTTPSATGAISLSLSAGSELIVIDSPVEIDGATWIPVREPVSGALGYVPSAMVTTESA